MLGRHGLLETKVRSSSTEVVGEVVLVVLVTETTGVMEAGGEMEGPSLVTHTVFFPMLDNGSSFFDLIFAYISLLNLVVISTRRKHLKKKREVYMKRPILTNSDRKSVV